MDLIKRLWHWVKSVPKYFWVVLALPFGLVYLAVKVLMDRVSNSRIGISKEVADTERKRIKLEAESAKEKLNQKVESMRERVRNVKR